MLAVDGCVLRRHAPEPLVVRHRLPALFPWQLSPTSVKYNYMKNNIMYPVTNRL
jgi:hypothetical protein